MLILDSQFDLDFIFIRITSFNIKPYVLPYDLSSSHAHAHGLSLHITVVITPVLRESNNSKNQTQHVRKIVTINVWYLNTKIHKWLSAVDGVDVRVILFLYIFNAHLHVRDDRDKCRAIVVVVVVVVVYVRMWNIVFGSYTRGRSKSLQRTHKHNLCPTMTFEKPLEIV